MKIGELARKAGCTVETIRYYEKAGLLQSPLRDINNNYRHYDHFHLEKLFFIRRCRMLEMTHNEIRELLLALDTNEKNSSLLIHEVINNHLTHVQKRITQLIYLEDSLKKIKDSCNCTGKVMECYIIKKMTAPDDDTTLSTTCIGGIHS